MLLLLCCSTVNIVHIYYGKKYYLHHYVFSLDQYVVVVVMSYFLLCAHQIVHGNKNINGNASIVWQEMHHQVYLSSARNRRQRTLQNLVPNGLPKLENVALPLATGRRKLKTTMGKIPSHFGVRSTPSNRVQKRGLQVRSVLFQCYTHRQAKNGTFATTLMETLFQ